MTLLTGEQCSARFDMVALPTVASRGYVTGCLAELGDFAEGRGVAEGAIRMAEVVEQPYSIAAAYWHAGLISRRQGDLQRAVPALERSLALCQTATIPRLFPIAASILAAAYALAGRVAEARQLLDQTLDRVATGSRVIFQALVLTELAEALLLVGRVDEASALAGRLLELSRTHIGSGYQAYAYRLLGEAAIHCDPPDVDQAITHDRQALALAKALGMRPLMAHCHHGLGRLYHQIGQSAQARATLTTAIDLYRTMDMTFWLPQAEVALTMVH